MLPTKNSAVLFFNRWNVAVFMALVAVLAAFDIAAFMPGLMTRDSQEQLAQAMSGIYTDHHPPVMAALWHVLLGLGGGSGPMLLFHVLLFWSAVAVLGLTYLPARPRLCYLFPALWFVPVLMGMTGVIWKDTGLAVSWMLASALMVQAYVSGRRPSWGVWALMGASFFYGFAVRHNALLGAWPLLLLAMHLYTPAWRRAALLSLGLLAVLMGATHIIDSMLVMQKTYIQQELFLEDIGCMSLKEEISFFPSYIVGDAPFLLDYARKKEVRKQGALAFNAGDKLFYTADPARVEELRGVWLDTIFRHPSDYLACRVQVFNALMRVGREPFYPYELRRPAEAPGNAVFGVVSGYLGALWDAPCNLPWLWAVGGMALAVAGYRRRDWPVLALTASALLYMGGYFFIATGADMRYIYWPIAAISLACVLHIMYPATRRAIIT